MKKSKKFLKVLSATAIAAIMATTMASTAAFAATGGTINVDITASGDTGVQSTDSLTYYKVANLTQNPTYNWEWNATAFGGTVPPEVSIYDLNNSGVTTDNVKTLANLLANKVSGDGTALSLDNITTPTKFTATVTDDGYYLVLAKSTNSAGKIYQPMLIEVKNGNPSEITGAKTSTITFDKAIMKINDAYKKDGAAIGKNDETAGVGAIATTAGEVDDVFGGDTAVAGKDDTVTYMLTAQLPAYDTTNVTTLTTKFQITDTLEDGLTYQNDVKVYLDNSTDGTVDAWDTADAEINDLTNTPASNGFTVALDDSVVLNNPNKKVFVVFTAKVNGNATVNADSNDNTATLTYANEYATGNGSSTLTDTVAVFTTKVDVNKEFYNEDGTKVTGTLPEATFELWKDGNKVADGKTSTADGTLTFSGLAEGTYTLKETVAPQGYKAAAEKTITITATKSDEVYTGAFVFGGASTTDSVTVENHAGKSLPGTGGVGTTMFTIGGIALVVVAGGMLTIYMKKRKTSEEE
ncbi:MAG: isopeptide-forming domain-containing fimbrial protein [Acutalibacteraceae bacterium]